MNISQLYCNKMIVFLLLFSHFVSFGMELSKRQPKQQENVGLHKTTVRLIPYSLDYMPREMQIPIFCKSGLSFEDKKNLSLVNKASHQNIRENVLQYNTIPSLRMTFAIDTIIYVADIAHNKLSCSII